MPSYAERLAKRKREFGKVCPTLSDNGNGHDTTVPAPLGEGYIRNYWAQAKGLIDRNPLPCERAKASLLRRFEY
jgi:hypothetical protein